ncbi:hypothetical protein LTR84_000868 [Exophiala bonariae]|uniref:Uncharacterized protein n=1 Tax=Exophiala bonariae TaxID=1690606 RepID=A0AAV9NVH4_9EURO|nr:hypothetical protein LTR84_000868 [Exophiala bonariae]
MPRQFLFVNKDADSSSLTRSTSLEQSSINSYVQRGRRHRRSGNNAGRSGNRARRVGGPSKRAAEEEAVIVDTPSTSASSESPTLEGRVPEKLLKGKQLDIPSRPHSRAQTVTPPSVKERPSKAQKPRSKSTSASSPKAEEEKGTILLLNSRINSPQDITQVIGSSLDPFGQSVVKLDPHVAKLCRYFAESYHPSVWNAERWGSADGAYTHLPSAKVVIQRAMQSEVEMNAMLAAMAARIENVDGIPNQGTNKYMGNALVAVRRRFSSASKDQLLLIMFHLYAGEAYRQNYQAAKIHMRAAKAIFASWGGLSQIPDPAIRELFIIGDLHVSAVLLEPPELPCDYDPGPYWSTTPLALQLGPEQELNDIAPALHGLTADGYLPDDLKGIIHEIRECAWVLRYGTVEPSPASKHAVKWLQWRSAAIRCKLLSISFSDASLEAVRVTLLLWVLITTVLLGLRLLGHRLAPKLQSLLRTAKNPYHQWKGRMDIQIWVITVGAMCAGTDSEEESWFVGKLFELGLPENVQLFREMQGPEATTASVLQNFQEKFFYYEKIQRPRLERLATLITVNKSSTNQTTDPVRYITPPT